MVDQVNEEVAAEQTEKSFDASDPAAVNRARKRGASKRTERLRVVEALMQHPHGRRWVYDLLERCHIFGNPFVPNDPCSTAFNVGEANIGRILLSDVVAAAPDQYVLMCREAREAKSH